MINFLLFMRSLRWIPILSLLSTILSLISLLVHPNTPAEAITLGLAAISLALLTSKE